MSAVRRSRAAFWAVAFAFTTLMAFSAIPTPLYAIYAQRDGLSSLSITIIFSAYAAGVIVSLFLAGHVSDWYGRRVVLTVALLTCVASALVFLAWSDLPGLILGRVVNGVGVGAGAATATAWLAELHEAGWPAASPRRAQIVATAANIGGLGVGPLVSGALAQWVAHPLVIPYVVALVALVVAAGLALAAPETRAVPVPRPRYRPQRAAVPAAARGRFAAAVAAAIMAFSTLGLFTSLAPSFLAGTLGHRSHALAGAAAFVVFGAAVAAQTATARRGPRGLLAGGMGSLVTGLALVVVAVWLPSPSLALFLVGGAVSGAGSGMLFKGSIATVAALATDDTRAEALAGLFLGAYVGLSVPVIGLGLLTQALAARDGLLVFAGLLAAGTLAPALLGGASRPAAGATPSVA